MNKRKILVPLGDKSYEVTLEAGVLNNISEELLKIGITKNRKILVISNEEISNLYGEKFLNNLKENKFQAKMFLIKAGESYKNLKTLSEIYDVAFEFGLDRNSIIIALGGGIVGDVSGFAAATWLRGIEYIQIPTTLLSMVDSSVGGKTGVNHPKGKNLIGAFNQPKAVFIDPETLINDAETLGFDTVGITKQGEALLALGLAERLYGIQKEFKEDLSNALLRREALLRLVDPVCLGDFKWFVFKKFNEKKTNINSICLR